MTLERLARRIRALFLKTRLDRDMDDEMRFHIEMETAQGVQRGLAPDEARRQALVAFGARQQYREEGREARGVSRVEDALADLRFGARMLRRSPVFAVVAITTLALGIGANSAIFSVVNGVLLRPLPYTEPDRLMSVWDAGACESCGRSKAEFVGVRDYNRTLQRTAAYMDRIGFGLAGVGEPLRLSGAYVTADIFQVLGVDAMLGRGFATGEDRPGDDNVVVLSYALWQDRFGGDSGVIGRRIELDGSMRTVIGVMPASFWFPRHETRLWVPLELNLSPARQGEYWGGYGYVIVGRLRDGATRAQTLAEVGTIARRLRQENPVWRPDTTYYLRGMDVVPLAHRIVQSGSRRLLLVLLGAVGMILLIACANVANLLLARGTARAREMAIRATLGAARERLVRQGLAESLLLGVLGGLVGLGLAIAAVRLMRGILPPDIPRLADVRISAVVLAFTAGLAVLVGVSFGLVPALRMSRDGAASDLAEGAARTGAGRGGRRLAAALVAGQIALAVVLVVGAGLLLRSFARLLAVDPGFKADAVATALVSPPAARWTKPEQASVFYGQLLERLKALPEVRDAALTSQLPFDQTDQVMAMWVDGFTTDPNNLDLFESRRVSPEFFQTMGISIVQGRGFTAADRAGTPLVAILDETAAERYWKGKNPVGGRIHYPWPGWIEVVGVVRTVKNNDLKAQPSPTFYVPFDQYPQVSMTVVARARNNAAAAAVAIRSAVRTVGPEVPLSDERTMTRLISDSTAQPRFASLLILGFGLLALLLGAVGTYGLMAYATERRAREIAVRMALGARPRDVMAEVLRDGARLAGIGVAIGLVLAVLLTRFLRGMLFEVSNTDPVVFAGVPMILGLVALLASYVPARRATRVDPMIALRSE